MSKIELPRFIIYQPNDKEFHICLEVGKVFFRWCSVYPPTLDVRYPRQVTRMHNLPIISYPEKTIFDEGTYTITKSDTKEAVQEKMTKGIGAKSFSFILNGRKLNGRFTFKSNKNYTILQKFKDKFAKDEDVLSRDLIRTINTMVPDYDETKVKLIYPRKTNKQEAPKEEIDDISADRRIGNVDYKFAHYSSGDGPEICLITSADDEALVLKKEGKQWILLSPVNRYVLKKKKDFTDHAKALFD